MLRADSSGMGEARAGKAIKHTTLSRGRQACLAEEQLGLLISVDAKRKAGKLWREEGNPLLCSWAFAAAAMLGYCCLCSLAQRVCDFGVCLKFQCFERKACSAPWTPFESLERANSPTSSSKQRTAPGSKLAFACASLLAQVSLFNVAFAPESLCTIYEQESHRFVVTPLPVLSGAASCNSKMSHYITPLSYACLVYELAARLTSAPSWAY